MLVKLLLARCGNRPTSCKETKSHKGIYLWVERRDTWAILSHSSFEKWIPILKSPSFSLSLSPSFHSVSSLRFESRKSKRGGGDGGGRQMRSNSHQSSKCQRRQPKFPFCKVPNLGPALFWLPRIVSRFLSALGKWTNRFSIWLGINSILVKKQGGLRAANLKLVWWKCSRQTALLSTKTPSVHSRQSLQMTHDSWFTILGNRPNTCPNK